MTTPPKRKKKFARRFWRTITRYLVTGLMLWVPLIVTVWVSYLIIMKVSLSIDSVFAWIVARINDVGSQFPRLGFLTEIAYIKGTGLILALALFVATGLFARYLVGRKIIDLLESIVDRIPLIRRVYRATQQIRDTFVGRGSLFQEVCLIEYPRPGVHVMGFVTSRERGVIQETLQKSLVAVFIPTTPNPTSGFLLYLRPEEVVKVHISVEEAMKLIVSAGAYLPGKKIDMSHRFAPSESEFDSVFDETDKTS